METGSDRKSMILRSAVELAMSPKLTNWSIAQVASRAGVAKGLVIYHFHTRQNLLREVAVRLRTGVNQRRLEALSPTGTAALDALREALEGEVERGEAAALLGLATSEDRETRESAALAPGDRVALAHAAAHALGLPHRAIPPVLLEAVINGLQLQMITGIDEDQVQEAWDQFWLLLVR
jgi:AcrR family transcriptional regulator